MDSPHDRTASLMTPGKLAQAHAARAPVSPAAWLDKMASDAGHMHLRRLAELQAELEAQALARADAPVGDALRQLAQGLANVDFSLLDQRGWWARTTGKARTAGAEFASRFERAEAQAAAVVSEVQSLHKRQAVQSGSTDRTLLEFEVEVRAVDKIIDQGARWLQDMRNQIKARHAQATDATSQRQIKDDTGRCEILVARLKALRAAATAAQSVHQQALATAARRAALLQRLQTLASSDLKAWRARLATVAAAAGEGKPGPLDGPLETHTEVQQCVQQAAADAAQLQTHERGLAQSLAALGQQLAAAG